MNLIDYIQPFFEILYPFILFSLLLFGWRAINSYWLKQETTRESNKFKKGSIKYIESPRPLSSNFKKYLQLALMSTPTRQKQLTELFSDSIKEYLELYPQPRKRQFSEGLNLLINDPSSWLQYQHDNIASLSKHQKKKSTSDFLYEEYISILLELEILLDIEMLNKMD
ncbi:MAG: hypothetical protein ACFE95_05995 [Candidatus Hodarchaeota archaeon]